MLIRNGACFLVLLACSPERSSQPTASVWDQDKVLCIKGVGYESATSFRPRTRSPEPNSAAASSHPSESATSTHHSDKSPSTRASVQDGRGWQLPAIRSSNTSVPAAPQSRCAHKQSCKLRASCCVVRMCLLYCPFALAEE